MATTAAWAFGFAAGAVARRAPLARLAALPLLACAAALVCSWLGRSGASAAGRRWRGGGRRRPALAAAARPAAAHQPASAPSAPPAAAPSSVALAATSAKALTASGSARAAAGGRGAGLAAESALPQATDALLRVLAQVLAPCQAALLTRGPDGTPVLQASQASQASAPAAEAAAATPAAPLAKGTPASARATATPPWLAALPPDTWATAQRAAGKAGVLPVAAAPNVRLACVAEAGRGPAAAPQLWGLLAVVRPTAQWAAADATLLEGVAGQLALAWSLEQALRASRRHLQRLERIATTDGLTELVNQRHFAKLFDLQLARARRYGRRLSLIFLDIDHFKEVNDTHGHQMGDAVLKKVAQVLRSTARCTDTVARLGGEEFAVLMEETGAKGAERYAERIRQALSRELFAAQGGAFRKTCSLGVATFPEHGQQAKDLMAHADEALYAAKRAGRNRTVIYRAAVTARESSP